MVESEDVKSRESMRVIAHKTMPNIDYFVVNRPLAANLDFARAQTIGTSPKVCERVNDCIGSIR